MCPIPYTKVFGQRLPQIPCATLWDIPGPTVCWVQGSSPKGVVRHGAVRAPLTYEVHRNWPPSPTGSIPYGPEATFRHLGSTSKGLVKRSILTRTGSSASALALEVSEWLAPGPATEKGQSTLSKGVDRKLCILHNDRRPSRTRWRSSTTSGTLPNRPGPEEDPERTIFHNPS
ncbi:hypothetical protein N431DRAFT_533956 [Stipitochalara longipes BDJ]|nr:hypothetical protein N431DRAFT_533956 [Stipitochalara longipes BDJ]